MHETYQVTQATWQFPIQPTDCRAYKSANAEFDSRRSVYTPLAEVAVVTTVALAYAHYERGSMVSSFLTLYGNDRGGTRTHISRAVTSRISQFSYPVNSCSMLQWADDHLAIDLVEGKGQALPTYL